MLSKPHTQADGPPDRYFVSNVHTDADRERIAFSYHDGIRSRRVNPLDILRALLRSPEWTNQTKIGPYPIVAPTQTFPYYPHGIDKHTAALRSAFGVPSASFGGLNDADLIELEKRLFEHIGQAQQAALPPDSVCYGRDAQAGPTDEQILRRAPLTEADRKLMEISYHDGVRQRRKNPCQILRSLMARGDGWARHAGRSPAVRLTLEGYRAGYLSYLAALREAFGVPPVEAGGLDDAGLVALESVLFDHIDVPPMESKPPKYHARLGYYRPHQR